MSRSGWSPPRRRRATPVIAFERGAIGEAIVDGVTGFLVTPGDIGSAADAVERARCRAERRAHATRHLDLERSLDSHEQLYRRLVGALRPGPFVAESQHWLAGRQVVTGASAVASEPPPPRRLRRPAPTPFAARDSEALDRLAARIRGSGGEATPAPTDVRRADEVERLFGLDR